MKKIEIICPHCGVSQNIDSNLKKAFCTFCGSSLNEVLSTLHDDYTSDTSNTGSSLSAQKSTNSKDSPFSERQEIPSLPRNLHLPNSQKKKSSNIPFQKTDQTTFPHQQQGSAAKLKFPQINKKINIPYIPAIFHFGRNLILPLVSAEKFDIDWLNSISRVRKQNNRVIHQHFVIIRGSNGKYYIEDNSSRWGTWVNRQQIKNKGKIELKNGDRIELMLSKPGIKQVFPFVIIFES